MADNKPITVFRLIKNFRSIIAAYKNETLKSFRKVLLSFEHFCYARYFYDTPFHPQLVLEWYAFLRLKGMTPNKTYYYVDKLGNLYSTFTKGAGSQDKATFKIIREKIREVEKRSLAALPVTFKTVEAILNFSNTPPQSANNQSINEESPRDLLLFSLYLGALSVETLSTLRKSDIFSEAAQREESAIVGMYPGCLPMKGSNNSDSAEPSALNNQALRIARKYSSPNRKYLFPLSQSTLTKKQLREKVAGLLQEPLRRLGIEKGVTDIDDLLMMLWIAAAVRMGLSPSVVADSAGRIPAAYSFIELCKGEPIDEDRKRQIDKKVAEFISSDGKKWYAMRLRPYVRYEQLIGRLSENDNKELNPEIFYPSEEIAKRIGKKIVWKERPIIRDIVFFKSFPDKVLPLFRIIWDLAWCYREGSDKSYAIIPKKAMERFQDAIGYFTPDFEIAPAGDLEMKAGEKIEIIGGDYKHHLGIILKSKASDSDDSNTVYRIELLDLPGKWNISVDARLIRRVTA